MRAAPATNAGPFALYEHEDPEYGAAMLRLSRGCLFTSAVSMLRAQRRNADNVAAGRGVDRRDLWQWIQALALEMERNCSRETKLGEGA